MYFFACSSRSVLLLSSFQHDRRSPTVIDRASSKDGAGSSQTSVMISLKEVGHDLSMTF